MDWQLVLIGVLYPMVLGSYKFTWEVYKDLKALPCARTDVEGELSKMAARLEEMKNRLTELEVATDRVEVINTLTPVEIELLRLRDKVAELEKG